MADRSLLWLRPAGLVLLAALAFPATAGAQPTMRDTPSGPPGTAPKATVPDAAKHDDRPLREAPNEAKTQEGRGGGPLSEQLSRSDGVLHPAQPEVDSEMTQAPPSTGPNSTPVIRPSENNPEEPNTKVTPK